MKQCIKWNYEKQDYELSHIPDECIMICDDMDKLIKCANCHKYIKYGDCYTSHQYHTHMGMGYPVCEECYNKEWEQRSYYERYKN